MNAVVVQAGWPDPSLWQGLALAAFSAALHDQLLLLNDHDVSHKHLYWALSTTGCEGCM